MKLTQLKYLSKLPLELRLQLIKYFVRRNMGFSYTQSEVDLDNYWQHLVLHNGTLENYTEHAFQATYELNIGKLNLSLRKSPSNDFQVFEQLLGKQFLVLSMN